MFRQTKIATLTKNVQFPTKVNAAKCSTEQITQNSEVHGFWNRMMFVASFWCLSVLCAVLYVYTRTSAGNITNKSFWRFQLKYLIVYLLAMAGDWLQGPHVYALYQSYGLSSHDIQLLFVVGFGSSMLVGTVVGSLADRYGRKMNCIVYGMLYSVACLTKHFPNFYVLMIGRFLGGTATSILYSAFESWLVYEHNKHGFSEDLLAVIFSNATLGNSLVAILAGFLAQVVADKFGFVAPFDISLCVLVVMTVVVMLIWEENYGDVTADVYTSFSEAVRTIRTDNKILCLGLIQSLFEGAMYTFVLEWTPALTPPVNISTTHEINSENRSTIPHGVIFSTFMVAVMIGSSIFKTLTKYSQPESFMRFILLIAASCLVTPVLVSQGQYPVFMSFLIFEVCVGVFWPAMSTMRGKYVPEKVRATVMNCFRLPLNLIVVIILLQNLSIPIIFTCCVVFLLLATVLQHWLSRLTSANKTLKYVEISTV